MTVFPKAGPVIKEGVEKCELAPPYPEKHWLSERIDCYVKAGLHVKWNTKKEKLWKTASSKYWKLVLGLEGSGMAVSWQNPNPKAYFFLFMWEDKMSTYN